MYARSIAIATALALTMAPLAVAADPLIHTVAKGETLYAIARRYEVPLDALMKANDIHDASRITVGLRLAIPGPVAAVPSPPSAAASHVVKKGETLYGIAKAYGVTVDALIKENGLAGNAIREGQSLRLPSGAPADTKVVAAPTSPVARAPEGTKSAPLPSPLAPTKPSAPLPKTSQTGVTWPAQGSISQLQGKLRGVEIAAPSGSAITAVRSGTVVTAGPFRGFDQVAFVQSSDELVYVYGGAAALNVKVGDSVRKGSVLGRLPTEPGPSAFFFVFKGSDTLDPAVAPRD